MSSPNTESPSCQLRSAPSLGQNQDSLPVLTLTELVEVIRQQNVVLANQSVLLANQGVALANLEAKFLSTNDELLATNDELLATKAENAQLKERAAYLNGRLDAIDREIKEQKEECKDHKMKAREADRDAKVKKSEKNKHRNSVWSSFVFALLCSILALVLPQIDKQSHPTPGAVSVVSTPFAGAGLVAIYNMVSSYLSLKEVTEAIPAYTNLHDELNGSFTKLVELKKKRDAVQASLLALDPSSAVISP